MSSEVLYEAIEDFGLIKKEKSKTLFSKIGIVGCGIVGQNFARVASFYGIEVVFIEVSEEKIREAYRNIGKVLDQRIEHWGLTSGEKRAILSRIKGSLDYKDLAGCDFVVEAIRAVDRGGKLKERKAIFKQIEQVVDEDCIIATNSTTIVITELASELVHRERCVSIHFLIASSEAKMVEVVKGLYTSEEAYAKVCKFVQLINRKVIPVEESAGLIAVRMFVVMLNEACEMLMEGISSIEHIDETMRIGFGMRLSPFAMADKMGLDKIVRWMDNIYNEFGDVRYKPSPYIKRLVRAKQLGEVTGKGFYEYDEEGNRIVQTDAKC
ncbi:3-hydroxyacyl-CoA dehydrogenase family protein [Mangrovibacterium diazotrophicum]|uniref:3-hydroxybutyryl-CoA dehydrogenase n=1 Tax=Mangrovibacterium diazotrophicum TaxID=1261403 RepID=A0A419VU30_9BACT|nr:3-hydroxyacyl-CoA dehydrogenase family protein [Mangrovibacterium diazotrophicum]RKD85030.1 3-hydroxybutyryl-CoA dehydrogenase [Mangrovibacterium diazotrophicum]